MMGSWMLVTGLASLFAGDFSGMIPEPTGTTAIATNPDYSRLFSRLGWGSFIAGVALIALIPLLRKLIQASPPPSPRTRRGGQHEAVPVTSAAAPESIVIDDLHGPDGVWGVRAFGGVPDDSIEGVLGALVWFGQRQARRDISVFPEQRVGDFFRRRIHWSRGILLVRLVKGGEIGDVGETVVERRGCGVHLVHRWQAEHQLQGAQQAGVVVLGAHDRAAAWCRG